MIIHGIEELPEKFANKSDATDDLARVKNITSSLELSLDIVSVRRLGKVVDVNKPQPIKVSFLSDQQAKSFLKQSRELSSQGIPLKNDMTVSQRDKLLSVKEKLSKPIESGDINLTIKFVKGVPTIVKKQSKN